MKKKKMKKKKMKMKKMKMNKIKVNKVVRSQDQIMNQLKRFSTKKQNKLYLI